MKIIIIGGNASGLAVASRLNRLDYKNNIIIFEKGDVIGYGNCGFPYALSGLISKNKLCDTNLSYFEDRTNSRIFLNHEVIKVNTNNREIIVSDNNKKESVFNYDRLVIASGVSAIKPDIPGINLPGIFILRDFNDFNSIYHYIKNNKLKRAIVIGGAFIGLEIAENLFELGISPIIIEKSNKIMPQLSEEFSIIIEKEAKKREIEILKNEKIIGISRYNKELIVTLKNGSILKGDILIFAIGVKPNTYFLKGTNVRLTKEGYVVVNKYMQTSNPHIFACGDVISIENLNYNINFPFAGPAIRQAKFVAYNILGKSKKYPCFPSPQILKFFDLQIGKLSKPYKKHFNKKTISVVYPHHVVYYPNARNIYLKIEYDNSNGEIINAELSGKDGIDKRLDIISTIMSTNTKIYDIEHLNLSYSPVFNIPQDIINIAGRIANNILDFSLEVINPYELKNFLKKQPFLLDVRTKEEFERGHFNGAVNIHLPDIKYNLEKIPKNKDILIYCATGDRSYQAQLLLKQSGYKRVYNLLGGYVWGHYLI